MRRRGFSLLEAVISLAVFSVLTVLLGLALIQSQKVWRELTGAAESDSQLKRVGISLRRELSAASFVNCSNTTVPAHLAGGAFDGDAIWFLSNVDSTTGQAFRKADGTPFWQHNVIYYLIVPGNHTGLYGFTCNGGVGPGGYDDRCPHKVLVRKEVDNPLGGSTNPTVETTEDTLLTSAQIGTYLTQTNQFSTAGMTGEAGFLRAHVVARALLMLNFRIGSNPSVPNQILVDARTVSIVQARKEVALGTASLATGRYTTQWDFSILPILP